MFLKSWARGNEGQRSLTGVNKGSKSFNGLCWLMGRISRPQGRAGSPGAQWSLWGDRSLQRARWLVFIAQSTGEERVTLKIYSVPLFCGAAQCTQVRKVVQFSKGTIRKGWQERCLGAHTGPGAVLVLINQTEEPFGVRSGETLNRDWAPF